MGSLQYPSPRAPGRRARALPGTLAAALLALAALILVTPAQAQTATTLVSNAMQDDPRGSSASYPRSQSFTTGANQHGYTLTGVEFLYRDTDDAAVSVCAADDLGVPNENSCTALTPPASFAPGTLIFTGNVNLDPNKNYSVLITSPGGCCLNVPDGVTSSAGEDETSESGWSIADLYRRKRPPRSSWSFDEVDGQSIVISIKGFAHSSGHNFAATGHPVIFGTTALVGVTLTADTSTIVDRNGLANVDFAYQWLRVDADGVSNETPVGTDSRTYRLTADDVGRKIRVRVTFTDDADNADERTSAATHTVLAADHLANTANADVLVSNIWRSIDNNLVGASTTGTAGSFVQGFTTGSAATLTSIDIAISHVLYNGILLYSVVPRVTVRSGTPTGPALATLTGPWALVPNRKYQTFVAPANTTLAASTTYFITLQYGSHISVQVGVSHLHALSGSEDCSGRTGWSIADSYGEGPSADSLTYRTVPLMIRVNGRTDIPPAARVPCEPRFLTATPRDAQVVLRWQEPRFDGGAAITKYQYRSSPGDAVSRDAIWHDVPDGSDAGSEAGDERAVTVAGLANGTQYAFQVRAVNRVGGSLASRTVTATPRSNRLPTASDPTVATQEDTAYTFRADDFNFTDQAGDTLASVKIETVPGVGELALSGTAVQAGQSVTRAELDAAGLTFTPVANEFGSAYTTFTFRVNDGTTESGSAYTMTIDVEAVNDPPASADAKVSTTEDTAYTFSANDFSFTDTEGDTLASVTVVTLPDAGELELSGTAVDAGAEVAVADLATLTFTPAANGNGDDYTTFTFRVSDGTDESTSIYTMRVDVEAVNDPPESADAKVSTAEDTTYTFSEGDFNFTDPDSGDALASVTVVTLPGVGELALSGAAVEGGAEVAVAALATLTFTPAANGNGSPYTTFTFRVSDGTEESTSAYTMRVDVGVANDPPTSADGMVSTAEDTPYTFSEGDFIFTDIDSGDALASVTIETVPDAGELALSDTAVDAGAEVAVADLATLTFTPAANGNGSPYATFTFRVSDGTDESTDDYTMTVNVEAVNDPPESADRTVSTAEDTVYTFSANDFIFTDTEGDALASVKIETVSGAGELELSGTAVVGEQLVTRAELDAAGLTFTPAADENGGGYATFTFRVNDGTDESTSAYTMTIDVEAVNDPPESADGMVRTAEDTPYTFSANDFIFTDTEGDTLASVKIETVSGAGELELSGTAVQEGTEVVVAALATLTFTPAADENGSGYATFTFRVNDGTDESTDDYTMTIDVEAVNDPPESADGMVSTAEDTPYTFSANDFIFIDTEGDALASVTVVTLPDAGELELSGTAVQEGTEVVVAALATLTFTSAADENGSGYATFTFRVNDGTDESTDDYTMTIDVEAVNDPPESADGMVSTAEDTVYTFSANDFIFIDTEGDALASVTVVTLPDAGELELSGTAVQEGTEVVVAALATLTFTPVANGNGSPYTTFTFGVSDGTDESTDDYTMTVNVEAVNDPPESADAKVSTAEDTPYTFSANDFIFTDTEGDALASVTVVTLPDAGELALSGTAVDAGAEVMASALATLTFTPAADENGSGYATFTIRVNDGTDESTSAYTMTIDVEAVNDPPESADRTVSTAEDTPYTFSANDFIFTDTEGDTLASVKIETVSGAGELALSGTAVTGEQLVTRAGLDAADLTFTPAADENGSGYATFTFRVNDGTDESTDDYTMTVNVEAVNDPPESADRTVSTAEDRAYTFSADDFSFTDTEGDALASVTVVTQPDAGELALSGTAVQAGAEVMASEIGGLTFTPAANGNGSPYTTFTFRVSDGTEESTDDYTMTIDVEAVNDPPESADRTVSTAEDTVYPFSANDFIFTDTEGDTLASVKIETVSGAGELALSGTAVTGEQLVTRAGLDAADLTFTPAADGNGSPYTTFTFRVSDGTDESTSAYTMTIDVEAVNDPPESADRTVRTAEDTPYTFSANDFIFTDTEGDTLASVKIETVSGAGELELSGTAVQAGAEVMASEIGGLTFTPAANGNGSPYTTFTFRVSDGTDESTDDYTMTVNVEAVNDPPESADRTVSTAEDTPYTFSANDFIFTDTEGDTLASVKIETVSGAGELALSGTAVTGEQLVTRAGLDAADLTFTPAADENGSGYATFTFRVNDGTDESTSAYTMTIDVEAVNDPPESADRTVSTAEDTPYTFSANDFIFTDTEGDTLASVKIETVSGAGELALSGTAVTGEQLVTRAGLDAADLTFTPAADENGSGYATFTFRVNDGTDESTSAYTMTIDVEAVNDPPESADRTVSTAEDTPYTFSANDFIFTDTEGDALASVKIETVSGAGELELSGTAVQAGAEVMASEIGGLTFTPAANGNGSPYTTFTFRVSDGTDESTSAYTMRVDVGATNDPPESADAKVETAEDTTYTFSANDFSFTDPDSGDALASVTVVTLPDAGELALSGTAVAGRAEVAVAALATLTFTPAANGNGSPYTTFTFRVSDGTEESTSAYTMRVDVGATNDPPESADAKVSTTEDTAYTFSANDFSFTDPDSGDALASVTIETVPGAGELALSGTAVAGRAEVAVADLATLTFTPAANGNGSPYTTFTFRVSDGTDESTSAYTMRVDVGATNDPPESADGMVSTAEDTTYTFSANDFSFTDPDSGDALASVTIETVPGAGELALSGTAVQAGAEVMASEIGGLTFTPAANGNGSPYTTFTFRVSDGTEESTSAYTMRVDVGATNDPPESADAKVSTTGHGLHVLGERFQLHRPRLGRRAGERDDRDRAGCGGAGAVGHGGGRARRGGRCRSRDPDLHAGGERERQSLHDVHVPGERRHRREHVGLHDEGRRRGDERPAGVGGRDGEHGGGHHLHVLGERFQLHRPRLGRRAGERDDRDRAGRGRAGAVGHGGAGGRRGDGVRDRRSDLHAGGERERQSLHDVHVSGERRHRREHVGLHDEGRRRGDERPTGVGGRDGEHGGGHALHVLGERFQLHRPRLGRRAGERDDRDRAGCGGAGAVGHGGGRARRGGRCRSRDPDLHAGGERERQSLHDVHVPGERRHRREHVGLHDEGRRRGDERPAGVGGRDGEHGGGHYLHVLGERFQLHRPRLGRRAGERDDRDRAGRGRAGAVGHGGAGGRRGDGVRDRRSDLHAGGERERQSLHDVHVPGERRHRREHVGLHDEG